MCFKHNIRTNEPRIFFYEVISVEYTHKKTIEIPGGAGTAGFVIRVYSPVISEEERARRMKAIYKAAENLLKKATVS